MALKFASYLVLILFLISVWTFPRLPIPNQLKFSIPIFIITVAFIIREKLKIKIITLTEKLLMSKAVINRSLGCFIREVEINGIYKEAEVTVSILFGFWETESDRITIICYAFVREKIFVLEKGTEHVKSLFKELDEYLKKYVKK